MRYPLLSRFQGSLIGLALAETLAQTATAMRSSATASPITLYQWDPNQERPSLERSLGWGIACLECAEQILQTGQWAPEAAQSIRQFVQDRREPLAAEWTIALLPVMLYGHEDSLALGRSLVQTLQTWVGPSDSEAGVVVVAQAIALMLRDQADPKTLLPQLATYLKRYATTLAISPSPLVNRLVSKLEQVHRLIQQGVGLSEAMTALVASGRFRSENEAIPFAFYCFLSTPENGQIALLRAARVAPISVCSLVGGLIGAYRGTSAFPIGWTSAQTPLASGATVAEIDTLATHLLTRWAGLSDRTQADQVAIAAPRW